MDDLASSVKVVGGVGKQRLTNKVTLNRREAFAKLPTIFLPKVLARDENADKGYRLLDYDRDILGELDWEAFRYLQADSIEVEEQEKLKRTIARVDLDQKKEDEAKLFFQEMVDHIPDEGLDIPFLVRQLLDVVPNPWQGMRILDDTLDILRSRGVSEKRLYVNRLDLLKAMKLDLKKQVDTAAETLFREKLESGAITLRLVSSGDAKLNWELAKTLEIDVSDEDRLLHRKDGGDIEKSLFEKVYQRDFNELEKETALYLDTRQSVNPRLNASFLEVVDNQLKANDLPETRQTLDRLIAQGISQEDAKIYVAQAVCLEVFDVLKNKKPSDQARYVGNLQRLPKEPKE